MGPISPPSASGNRYVLTLSDYITKWVEAIPLPTKEAHGVGKELLKVIVLVIINLLPRYYVCIMGKACTSISAGYVTYSQSDPFIWSHDYCFKQLNAHLSVH